MYMEHRTEFDKLINMRICLNEHLNTLETTLSEMKDKYKEFTKNNSKKIYLYSLDSFFFQYKILHVEFEHYRRFLTLINNRMYGDYYKLFMIIIAQSKESNLPIRIEIDDLLVYKDLEPMYDYTIENVTTLFDKIVVVMEQLRELYRMNSETISSNNSTNGVGFSIAAFFTTLKYENIILNEQIRLYLDFLKFYQSSQQGHLSKASVDVARFSDEINGKVLVNYQVEIDSLVKPKLMNEPVTEHVIETITEPVTEPSTESVTEPVIESVTEPVIEAIIEPVIEQASEPVTEPVTEPVIEQASEPVTEPVMEPVTEPVTEHITEPVTEPVLEQATEPALEQATEPVLEPALEQATEPALEQASEPVIEQFGEPVSENIVQNEPVPNEPVPNEPVPNEPVPNEPVPNEPVQEQPPPPAIKPKNNTPKSRGRPKMALG